MRSNKETNCTYCQSVKVVKIGVKRSGAQNLLCEDCGKQFQNGYVYWACEKESRDLVMRMLVVGSGVRDCAEVLAISTDAVLRCILRNALSIEIRPVSRRYKKVQIDELWPFVGKRKRKYACFMPTVLRVEKFWRLALERETQKQWRT